MVKNICQGFQDGIQNGILQKVLVAKWYSTKGMALQF